MSDVTLDEHKQSNNYRLCVGKTYPNNSSTIFCVTVNKATLGAIASGQVSFGGDVLAVFGTATATTDARTHVLVKRDRACLLEQTQQS